MLATAPFFALPGCYKPLVNLGRFRFFMILLPSYDLSYIISQT